MRASLSWLTDSGEVFRPEAKYTGTALLRHYTARFSVWGDGPPLVLIPGLAGGIDLIAPLAGELARDFQVISYHLRGEDDPFALRRRFELSDLVEDLTEFMDWFGLERPTLLGVSFGGVLGLELAIRSPGRVNALITQGVGSRFEPGLLQQAAGHVLSRYPLPVDNPFVNQFFNLFFGGKQPQGPLFDFVTRTCWRTDQSVMAHRFGMAEQTNFVGRLANMQAPSLVMAGERDMLVSATGLRELATEIPSASWVRLPGCGHLAFVTHPQRLATEVRTFLGTI